MTIYADSSVFVSIYINDGHSQDVKRGLVGRPDLWFTPLHRAEWTHAVEQHVFRGLLSSDKALQIHRNFAADAGNGIWVEVDLPGDALETAVELARKYVARLGTRTLDTLHVACALELKAERFWTFDERQKKLARAAGLKTS